MTDTADRPGIRIAFLPAYFKYPAEVVHSADVAHIVPIIFQFVDECSAVEFEEAYGGAGKKMCLYPRVCACDMSAHVTCPGQRPTAACIDTVFTYVTRSCVCVRVRACMQGAGDSAEPAANRSDVQFLQSMMLKEHVVLHVQVKAGWFVLLRGSPAKRLSVKAEWLIVAALRRPVLRCWPHRRFP